MKRDVATRRSFLREISRISALTFSQDSRFVRARLRFLHRSCGDTGLMPVASRVGHEERGDRFTIFEIISEIQRSFISRAETRRHDPARDGRICRDRGDSGRRVTSGRTQARRDRYWTSPRSREVERNIAGDYFHTHTPGIRPVWRRRTSSSKRIGRRPTAAGVLDLSALPSTRCRADAIAIERRDRMRFLRGRFYWLPSAPAVALRCVACEQISQFLPREEYKKRSFCRRPRLRTADCNALQRSTLHRCSLTANPVNHPEDRPS